jgi:RES domain
MARLPESSTAHTSYPRRHWPSLFNDSSKGAARFSPLIVGGTVIPTMYAAEAQTAALLETSFHDVHATGMRLISVPSQLATRGLVALTAPTSLPLIDLTDEGLARVGLTRSQLVSTTPEHYGCTREWAVRLHRHRFGSITPVGLMWQSRIVELARADSLLLGDLLAFASLVFMVFGDRSTTDPTAWRPGPPHYDDLSTGDGRLLAEQIAEQLGAVIVPA